MKKTISAQNWLRIRSNQFKYLLSKYPLMGCILFGAVNGYRVQVDLTVRQQLLTNDY